MDCTEEGLEPLCTSESFCRTIFDNINSISNQNFSNARSPRTTNNHPLSLTVLNAQSIKNKQAIMSNMIEELQPNVMIISETWLSPDILNSEIFPNGYRIFRKDRADCFGGILIACQNGITCGDIYI